MDYLDILFFKNHVFPRTQEMAMRPFFQDGKCYYHVHLFDSFDVTKRNCLLDQFFTLKEFTIFLEHYEEGSGNK